MDASLLEICSPSSSYLCSNNFWLPLLNLGEYNSEIITCQSFGLSQIQCDFPASSPQNVIQMMKILVIASFQSYNLPQGP